MVVIFPSFHSLCQKSQQLPDLNVQDIDCSFTFSSLLLLGLHTSWRSLWVSSNKTDSRVYVFATSLWFFFPVFFQLHFLLLSLNYRTIRKTTVCALLLTRTRSLSYSLFACLSAFPWLLLQTTTTITTNLSSRHNTVWKIDHRQFFILFFLRHQWENTEITFAHTTSPFPEK